MTTSDIKNQIRIELEIIELALKGIRIAKTTEKVNKYHADLIESVNSLKDWYIELLEK